jgi:hypothetical protein
MEDSFYIIIIADPPGQVSEVILFSIFETSSAIFSDYLSALKAL